MVFYPFYPLAETLDAESSQTDHILARCDVAHLLNHLHLSNTKQKVDICYTINMASHTVISRVSALGVIGYWFDPSLSYFSFKPVLHNWCNKGHGMYYPVSETGHIIDPLLLFGKRIK